MPDCSGKNLLIVSDGERAPIDLTNLLNPTNGLWLGDVMAVNTSGLLWCGHLDHWVTSHSIQYFTAREWRRTRWNDWNFLCHTHWRKLDTAHHHFADVNWEFTRTTKRAPYEHQNSSLLALAVAKGLGYGQGKNIIVAVGIDFHGYRHYYDLTAPPTSGAYQRYIPYLKQMKDEGRLSNVYGVSGWLAENLGTPPREQNHDHEIHG